MRPADGARWFGGARLVRWLVRKMLPCVGTILFVSTPAPLSATDEPIQIRYRSAESVYLDAGKVRGVRVGDRFVVERESEAIAEIEVAFAADYSASCRILDERQRIAVGDTVRRLQLTTEGSAASTTGRLPAPESESAKAGAKLVRATSGKRPEKSQTSRILRVNDRISCLRLRPSPDLEGEPLACLPSGTIATEIASVEGWSRIELDDGRQGWSAARFLEPIQLPVEPPSQVARAVAEESPPVAADEKGREDASPEAEQAEPAAPTAPGREVFLADVPLPGPADVDGILLEEIARKRVLPDQESDRLESPGPAVRGFRVRYRAPDILYIDAGEGEGLGIGDPLEVVRDGRIVAYARVAALAGHSAAVQLLAEYETVQIDDLVRASEAAGPETIAAGSSGRLEGQAAAATAELALDTSPVAPIRLKEEKRRRTHTRVSGTMTLDWETFTDQTNGEKFGFDRAEARLNLRVRDIGGLPYELRVRMRTQQNQRSISGVPGSQTENRNRYYELSLTYDPPQGRYAYRVGRLSSSPFVGIGYIDGVLGQMALSSVVEVGAFAGSGSDVEEFAPDTSRQKYGLFTRFTSSKSDSGLPWEVIMAGVREHGQDDVSREFLTLQSRYLAKRWSFYQRAELDINNGWRRELSGKSSQLSNFTLTATGRFWKHGRASLSYDLFEQYRTEETRSLPDELFNDFQRQGLRARLQFGNPRGINAYLNAGFRDQEGESENTTSYGFGLRHGNIAARKISLGVEFLGFSNQFTEGHVATLRTAKRLRGGHHVSLKLGNRVSQSVQFDSEPERSTQYARLACWLELPKNLFAAAEFEATQGDDLQGQRLNASLGYRF